MQHASTTSTPSCPHSIHKPNCKSGEKDYDANGDRHGGEQNTGDVDEDDDCESEDEQIKIVMLKMDMTIPKTMANMAMTKNTIMV